MCAERGMLYTRIMHGAVGREHGMVVHGMCAVWSRVRVLVYTLSVYNSIMCAQKSSGESRAAGKRYDSWEATLVP